MERRELLLNMTEIKSQFSGPLGEIRQVEVCMYIALATVSGLCGFGSLRRSSNNELLRYSIMGAFLFSFSLITFTIGQMLSSPYYYNLFYPFWATFLVLLYGNPHRISTYSLEDNDQWRKYQFTFIILMFGAASVMGTQRYLFPFASFMVTSIIMVFVSSGKGAERAEALALASKAGFIRGTKLIADFMCYEHELGQQLVDPIHLRGYHYLVAYEDKVPFLQYPSYASKFSGAVENENHTIESRLEEYKLATKIAVGVVITLEILHLVLFVISDWGKLLILCKYVQKQSWRDNRLFEQFIRVSCDISGQKNCWGRELGQYSFLDSFHRYPPMWIYNWFTAKFLFLENPGRGCVGKTFVKLSTEVQGSVLSLTKRKGRRLTKGIQSLRENGVRNHELFSACQYDTTTQVIMVWHIATSLCEIHHERSGDNTNISITLSKYCAYLVVFAPRLLPDHSYVTECIFKETVKEAVEALKGCYKSTESKYTKIMAVADTKMPMENRSVRRRLTPSLRRSSTSKRRKVAQYEG
ncbi:OLC1v1012586C1 [Oldenlandia corymbosa var. corymbosa]|uniref:OLC1v1012586C1 n=1 Tax=Oldenlandia corymbosa var. corymbosa TaxID=529605 RepID=A0AAV1DZ93_OLDCO|nr:OLC1v1012586C1 [Oldenlandia corymbosa var. corymbosa]